MEKFNFFRKEKSEDIKNIDQDKNKENIKDLNTLEGKFKYIERNDIITFEQWLKKSFDEKLSILSKLDAMPDNFNHFEKNYDNELQKKVKRDFDKDNQAVTQELDRNFDFFMRLIKYPGYIEQTKLLYPIESENLADTEDNPDYKKYYEYSDHKYPEELLDIKPDVLESFKKREERGEHKKSDHDYLFSPVEAIKNGGIKNLFDWYNKSIDEKRKILMSSRFFLGVDIEVEKGKLPLILQFGRNNYIKYLDQCFYSTIYRISEVLRWQNQWINYNLNKDEIMNKCWLNQEEKLKNEFEHKIIKLQNEHNAEVDEYLSKLQREFNENFPDMSNDNKEELMKLLNIESMKNSLKVDAIELYKNINKDNK